MSHKNTRIISVAEGMLPLLDVSVLLLGFFIILLASGAFSQNSGTPAPTDQILPGIGQVILLRIQGADSMVISGGTDMESAKTTALKTLSDDLKSIRQAKGEDEPLVLIYYEDPWVNYPHDFDAKITSAIRKADCRFARTYP